MLNSRQIKLIIDNLVTYYAGSENECVDIIAAIINRFERYVTLSHRIERGIESYIEGNFTKFITQEFDTDTETALPITVDSFLRVHLSEMKRINLQYIFKPEMNGGLEIEVKRDADITEVSKSIADKILNHEALFDEIEMLCNLSLNPAKILEIIKG